MDTKKTRITGHSLNDNGIKVSELIKLLTPSNHITKDLLSELHVEDIKDEFVAIKGAKALVNSQLSIEQNYMKVDLLSKLKDISFYQGTNFCFNFNNINDSLNFPKVKSLIAHPIYSAQRDFFSSLFGMDKYAKTLIEKKQKKILNTNLRLLKNIKKFEKRYRLIFNKSDKKYYLRGIVSKDNYFDYNNSVAIVIGLLTLHHEMKKNKINYFLRFCEYNESNIRMVFNTSQTKDIKGVGLIRNIIEISNDEIKREALKFYGVCSIIYNKNKTEEELFIRPTDVKSKILSIKHNQKPETAIKELSQIENTEKIHSELYKDIKRIKNTTDTEQIKFLIRQKITNSRNDEIKVFQSKILREIDKSITKNIINLLTLFNKIQLISHKDIEASEYLRFLFYEVLIKRK